MKYTDRQVSRGFGFCIFENPESAELAMKTKVHMIDGRKVQIHVSVIISRWMYVGHFPRRWLLHHRPQVLVHLIFEYLGEQPSKPAIRKIFVGGLSVDTNDC